MKKFSQKSKIMKMRVNGFYRNKAKWWVNAVEYDQKYNMNYPEDKKEAAYNMGFLPEVIDRYGINEENKKDFLSIHDYAFLFPINDIFRKWLKDSVTTRKVLKPFKKYLPEQYFHIYLRDMEPMIIKLDDCPEQYADNFESVIELVKDKKIVRFGGTRGFVTDIIKYENNVFYVNDRVASADEVIDYIKEKITKKICVISEFIKSECDFASEDEYEPNILRLIVYNKYADNPKIGQAYLRVCEKTNDHKEVVENMTTLGEYDTDESTDESRNYRTNLLEDQIVVPRKGDEKLLVRNYYVPVNTEDGAYNGAKYLTDDNKIVDLYEKEGISFKGVVPYWEELVEVIENMGMFIPQIEIMGIDVIITKDGFKFVDFNDHPYYPQTVGFNREMTEYFKLKVAQKKNLADTFESKKSNLMTRINKLFWVRLTKRFSLPKMRPLIYKWWYITVKEDLFSRNGISLPKKIWAYRHGFLSYRLEQYGITKDNFRNFISDYDYRYLRHINNKYRVWLEDKLSVKYICDEYSECFPKYYYHFSVRNGEKRVIRLMDLPQQFGSDPADVLKLVQSVGTLACKPQRGSQGQGFYKLSFEDGKYYLNHEEATEAQILDILTDEESQYFVTEYIKQHEKINKIYPGAVNTLRIITFMKDGKTPQIGNAYMRFGSQKTGAVDNMGAGGMFVQVDMETGRFYNGKIITENSILPCSHHPDTNELIEGYLPNWDYIKKGVIDLHLAMPQLEYLGFDVAISEEGMKLPEINRAPGYPKIETFNSETIDYLLYKREVKMKKNNLEKTKW